MRFVVHRRCWSIIRISDLDGNYVLTEFYQNERTIEFYNTRAHQLLRYCVIKRCGPTRHAKHFRIFPCSSRNTAFSLYILQTTLDSLVMYVSWNWSMLVCAEGFQSACNVNCLVSVIVLVTSSDCCALKALCGHLAPLGKKRNFERRK